MSDKFQNKYRIPSARLQNWDYSSNAMYFVTICTKNREWFFGEIADGKLSYSNTGIIADIMWHEIKNHAKNVELGEFVVMPNHIHGILMINNDNEIAGTTDSDGTTTPFDGTTTPFDGTTGIVGTSVIVETLHATSLPYATTPQPPDSNNEFLSKISPKSGSLSTIIRSYKSAVSKHAHRLGYDFFWQSRFHDHIIRDANELERISNYIVNNPAKWADDKFFKS